MRDPHALDVARAIANLDDWLQTTRQSCGYGGPVAHWWQNRFLYTGPGLDWRYEGLLIGYSTLWKVTGQTLWRDRLESAAHDLVQGQHVDGSFPASRFEINPGTLGTPHEAAACVGLLVAMPYLDDPDAAYTTAERSLDNLVTALWDDRLQGFDDRPGVVGRVPNKLATLAHALMLLVDGGGDTRYVPFAHAALDTVLRFQVRSGPHRGAVHQYAPGGSVGDGRYFPYYAARCVPPLVLAARFFDDDRYRAAAEAILDFIERTLNDDGSWPQVVYENGRRATWPCWVAGAADIMLAFHELGRTVPPTALSRVLAGQSQRGGFATAHGFAAQIDQRRPQGAPDYRDTTPVVGWNDKVLRLLSLILHEGSSVADADTHDVTIDVNVWGRRARYIETERAVSVMAGTTCLYAWHKDEPWARTADPSMEIR